MGIISGVLFRDFLLYRTLCVMWQDVAQHICRHIPLCTYSDFEYISILLAVYSPEIKLSTLCPILRMLEYSLGYGPDMFGLYFASYLASRNICQHIWQAFPHTSAVRSGPHYPPIWGLIRTIRSDTYRTVWNALLIAWKICGRTYPTEQKVSGNTYRQAKIA